MQQIIGFANLDNQNPFATAVQANLEQFFADYSHIHLMARSNNLDSEQAQANVQAFTHLPV